MGFGDVIRSALFPTSDDSRGIGGTSSKIWATSVIPNIICELSIVDFSIVRSENAFNNAGDIGGDESKIWYKDLTPDTIHEVSLVDFSSVRSKALSGRGVGGNSSKIWHGNYNDGLIQELSLADFSILRSEDAPGAQTMGIGGDSSKIWHCNYSGFVYELSIVDFSVVKTKNLYGDIAKTPWGIGGDSGTIWCNTDISHMVHELSTGEAIETLRPDAIGDECTIALESGCSACPDHYDCVDEVEPDEDTTNVFEYRDNYYRDLYNIENHTVGSGTINLIKVYARAKWDSGHDQASLKICIKTGGTAYESTEKDVTGEWADYSEQWATNPQAGRAWNWDDIDALQIGVSLRKSDASGSATRCTQVWVEVDYGEAEEEEEEGVSMFFHRGRTTTIFIGDD